MNETDKPNAGEWTAETVAKMWREAASSSIGRMHVDTRKAWQAIADAHNAEMCDKESQRKIWKGMADELQQQLAELEQWKKSALAVMPTYQEIGKELDLPIGTAVHSAILPAIRQLKQDAALWRQHFYDERNKGR